MKGLLTLIPTPLQEDLPLEPQALELLHKVASDPESLILVEELKVGRQRWLRWGLPRETIERFIPFNEHTHSEQEKIVLPLLKKGAQAILMSDGGLPAFCDPGQQLVNLCHENKIRVTSTSFPNSIALSLALSGFSHHQFFFAGFLPQKDPERKKALEGIWKNPHTQILMDTPYRRARLLDELAASCPSSQTQRKWLLALELNGSQEKLLRGDLRSLIDESKALEKQEFILVLDQLRSAL